jgi:hypothetical protein
MIRESVCFDSFDTYPTSSSVGHTQLSLLRLADSGHADSGALLVRQHALRE